MSWGGDGTDVGGAIQPLEWILAEGRAHGVGSEVRPHSWFHSTSCPGDALRAWITLRRKNADTQMSRRRGRPTT